jgi:hypothetical protein
VRRKQREEPEPRFQSKLIAIAEKLETARWFAVEEQIMCHGR